MHLSYLYSSKNKTPLTVQSTVSGILSLFRENNVNQQRSCKIVTSSGISYIRCVTLTHPTNFTTHIHNPLNISSAQNTQSEDLASHTSSTSNAFNIAPRLLASQTSPPSIPLFPKKLHGLKDQ